MKISCPNCQQHFEIEPDQKNRDFVCSSCGWHFNGNEGTVLPSRRAGAVGRAGWLFVFPVIVILAVCTVILFFQMLSLRREIGGLQAQLAAPSDVAEPKQPESPPWSEPLVNVQEQLTRQQQALAELQQNFAAQQQTVRNLDAFAVELGKLNLFQRLNLVQQQYVWTLENIQALYNYYQNVDNYAVAQNNLNAQFQDSITDIYNVLNRCNMALGTDTEFPGQYTVLGRLNELERDIDRNRTRRYYFGYGTVVIPPWRPLPPRPPKPPQPRNAPPAALPEMNGK
ncbi:hypothetical protein [Victivallis sp. Marseille-Q1083]|uniref:hypothetical protein n=1 Tax=Victivallis sp. Marseille-Q1083 TaxID=2717288 RepID=UPI00158B1DDD|nr:hypothetical protein [Victivallis sp. Marseille-Q1083]